MITLHDRKTQKDSSQAIMKRNLQLAGHIMRWTEKAVKRQVDEESHRKHDGTMHLDDDPYGSRR